MNISSKILTIIICTYNRNNILRLCLNSISAQSINPINFNVVIVNNYDCPKVSAEIRTLIIGSPNISLVEEKRAGLSIARNSGAYFSKTKWVAYLDDDCIVPEDFVEKALDIIKWDKYDCFGGHINSWWHYSKPRWMKPTFGTKPKLSDQEVVLKEDYNWGGNIFFKKEMLLAIGGFDEDIGMKKNKIGYSAENRVQIKMKEIGHRIGYILSLSVNHLVAPHKYKLLWHIKAAYAEGRDGKTVFPEQYTSSKLLKDFLRLPLTEALSIYKWATLSNYYWENLFLDVFKPIFLLLGKLRARLK